jgi:hypothetical protein
VTAGNAEPAGADDGAELPLVDEHAVEVAAPPDVVWAAAWSTLARAFSGRGPDVFARLVGCRDVGADAGPGPAAGARLTGFRVVGCDEPRVLALAGEHRFSRYRLTVRVDEVGGGRSRVRAETRAVFPGRRGALYRAVVVGARLHVLVVRRLLRAARRRAEARAGAPQVDAGRPVRTQVRDPRR